MEGSNFFTSKFGSKSMKEKKKKRVYFQRKINTEKYPNIQKILKSFFNDSNKYFHTNFEDQRIIVGKQYNKHKPNIPLSLTESNNQKYKNKKYLKRPTIKRSVLPRTDSLSRSKLYYDDKRKSFEDSFLKPGQRFIEDKEIEKLFNLYRELRKINKYKSHNFIDMKELKEKMEKNINLTKSDDILVKMYTSPIVDKNYFNSTNIKDKKFGTLIVKNHIDLNNDSEYNRTISTNIGGTNPDELVNYNFKNESNKEENDEFNYRTNFVQKRKELVERQNQYLYKDVDQCKKKYYGESLAIQENALLFKNKNKKYQNHFQKFLHNRLKTKMSSKLLIQDDSHRKNIELKNKILFFQNKLNPERVYDWYYELHSSKSSQPFLDSKFETIRNTEHMKSFPNIRCKTLEKDDYLRNIITSKYYKSLEKEINNINNNYGDLHVNGKNLLELENNLAKRLKGRKIINDYERLMSPSKLQDVNICSNFIKKI